MHDVRRLFHDRVRGRDHHPPNEESETGADETNTESVILCVGDTYTLTVSSDSTISCTDDTVVSVSSDIALKDHIANTASSLSSFSTEVNTTITLSQAEFTLTEKRDNVYAVQSTYNGLYLTNANYASTFFSSNASNNMLFTLVENGDGTVSYRICKANTNNRYVIFYAPQMNFNANSSLNTSSENNGYYELILLQKNSNSGNEVEVIPGYTRASSITSGEKYLIAYEWEGSYIVLYPENGTANQTKLVDPSTYVVTITGMKEGTSTVTVGDTTYEITVIAEGATAVKLHEDESTTLTVSGSITSSNDSIETTVISSLIGKLSTGDDLPNVSSALYTFTGSVDDGWVIYNTISDDETVYLNVSDGTNRGYPNTTSEQTLTLAYEDGDYFTIKDNSTSRYLAFYDEDKNNPGVPCFDEGKWTDDQISDGVSYVKFYFYCLAEEGDISSAELPGYVKLTTIDQVENGGQYLIVACLNGSYYALYPSNSTSSKADHVIELCYQLDVKGVSSGSTTLTVGGSIYQVIVSAHTWDDGEITQDATCTEDGERISYCTYDGCEAYTTETISATGHTAGETVIENEVAATCTTDGSYDNVVYCTVCDAELSRETVTIPATGHSSGSEWQSDEDEHWLVCETCGETTDLAQHTYGDWVITKEATDTEDGTRVKTCTVCGYTVTETISATGSSTDDDTDDSSDTVTATTTDTTSAADSTTAVTATPADTADTANPALWSLLLLTACVGLTLMKLRSRRSNQS